MSICPVYRVNDSVYLQEWVALFTTNPRVLSYRWYTGNDCPTEGYSFRDDLYVLPAEEVLSPLEQQERSEGNTLIGTGGLHSADGYICMALSEAIHPSNLTALHELAHAIVYVEYGLTGHNKIHDEKVIELALKFDESDCHTKDAALINLIAWNKPLFQRYPFPTKDYVSDPLFNFCYGGVIQPTPTPAMKPSPTPTTLVIPTDVPTTAFDGDAPMVQLTKLAFLDGVSVGEYTTSRGLEGLAWYFSLTAEATESHCEANFIEFEGSFKTSLAEPSITDTISMRHEGGAYMILAIHSNEINVDANDLFNNRVSDLTIVITNPQVHIWPLIEGEKKSGSLGTAWGPDANIRLVPRTSTAGARHLESIRARTVCIASFANFRSIESEWSLPLVFEFPVDYPVE